MKPPANHLQAALAAIRHFRYAAARGDTGAAAALAAIGNAAAGSLDSLAVHPQGAPGRAALDAAAADCDRWPVTIPAIGELRQPAPTPPATLGKSLPIRAAKGRTKRRKFDYDSQTGFALVAFEDLNRERLAAAPEYAEALRANWHLLTEAQKTDWHRAAAVLPPLDSSPASVGLWGAAAGLWAEDCCAGRWMEFPWPAEALRRAKQMTNTRKRGIATAVREMLKRGIKELAPPCHLSWGG
jgi:hypothetical protein